MEIPEIKIYATKLNVRLEQIMNTRYQGMLKYLLRSKVS